MDVMSAASSLRQQLVALQNTDTTITQIESQLDSLGQQSMMSTLEDNQSHHLRLLLRLSVTEGVRNVYQQYSTSKWSQIQNTARSIKSSQEDSNELTTPEFTITPSTGRPSNDKAVSEWTTVMCELSRHE